MHDNFLFKYNNRIVKSRSTSGSVLSQRIRPKSYCIDRRGPYSWPLTAPSVLLSKVSPARSMMLPYSLCFSERETTPITEKLYL